MVESSEYEEICREFAPLRAPTAILDPLVKPEVLVTIAALPHAAWKLKLYCANKPKEQTICNFY